MSCPPSVVPDIAFFPPRAFARPPPPSPQPSDFPVRGVSPSPQDVPPPRRSTARSYTKMADAYLDKRKYALSAKQFLKVIR